jgi:hypothetical protein
MPDHDAYDVKLYSQVELDQQCAQEYERGKLHGACDRRMIERQNQALGREIQQLKTELAKLKVEMHKNQR